MRKYILRGLIAVLVVSLFFGIMRTVEPRYYRRTLSSWLDECAMTGTMETQKLVIAQSAIRAMDSRKVIPELLRMIQVKDTRARAWLVNKSMEPRYSFLHVDSAVAIQVRGMAGFEVL